MLQRSLIYRKNAQRWWIATFPAEIEKPLILQQTQLIVVAAGLEWPIWAFHVRTYQTPKAVYFTSIVLFITTQWLIIAELLKSNNNKLKRMILTPKYETSTICFWTQSGLIWDKKNPRQITLHIRPSLDMQNSFLSFFLRNHRNKICNFIIFKRKYSATISATTWLVGKQVPTIFH